MYVIVVNKSQ